MLSKIALLFLLAMGVLALVGRLRFPGAIGRRVAGRTALKTRKCPSCGSYIIGSARCPCTAKPGDKGR